LCRPNISCQSLWQKMPKPCHKLKRAYIDITLAIFCHGFGNIKINILNNIDLANIGMVCSLIKIMDINKG